MSPALILRPTPKRRASPVKGGALFAHARRERLTSCFYAEAIAITRQNECWTLLDVAIFSSLRSKI